MKREELGDLQAFLAVIEAGSFTKAAARLGTSQSALSLTVKRLEARHGLRLIQRTTRQLAPTEAGARLALALRPAFAALSQAVAELAATRARPAGRVRISTSGWAAETILWPKLSALMRDFPEIEVELSIDSRFTDIVAEGFDAGVRLGESLQEGMIATRIGPDMTMALVASPALAERPPLHPHDLVSLPCLNLRFQTHGNLYAWEFAKDGRALTVRVKGPATFNTPALCRRAALEGHGWAFLPEDHLTSDLAEGRLVRALEDWCPPFAGYHLYYPSRQVSPALALVVDRLRVKT